MHALARRLGRGVIEEVAARPKRRRAWFRFSPLVAAAVGVIRLFAVRDSVAHLSFDNVDIYPGVDITTQYNVSTLLSKFNPNQQYLVHRNTPPTKALELALLTAGAAHLHPPLTLLCILLAAEALRRLRALVIQLPS